MEVTDYTKIVLDRIQKIEPENATKILGYLLLHHSNQEIMECAFGSDQQILLLINDAKAFLSSPPNQLNTPNQMISDQNPNYFNPKTLSRQFSSPSSFRVPAPYLSPLSPTNFSPPRAELEEPFAINNLGLNPSRDLSFLDSQISRNCLRSPPSLSEFPNKVCHYFNNGYCRHGSLCKFAHDEDTTDGLSQIYGLVPNDFLDDHIMSPRSLKLLEVEISELLKARRGLPLSIASLPSLYLETYGKTLQADGYLTESQRHGKAGFSLTKLLARLGSIQLIDRPHGQHAIMLAEDASKYEYRNEKFDSGIGLTSAHQIYLTFPAESSFTDDDVLNYFQQFGPVRDVRIPRQEKRMFGFVTFYYAETVRQILSKGHPHNICGSRVLVKPYKEKARMHDRRFIERSELPMYTPHFLDLVPEPNSMSIPEHQILLRKQLEEEYATLLELERMRLNKMQLSPKPVNSHSYFNFGPEDLNFQHEIFNPFPFVQVSAPANADKPQLTDTNLNDQPNAQVELPDSPFASLTVGENINTAI